MKKYVFWSFCFITIVSYSQQSTDEFSAFNNYSYQEGDPYYPGVSAMSSFILPGLGQFINGEPRKGVLYLLGTAISAGAFYTGYKKFQDTREIEPGESVYRNRGRVLGWGGLISQAVLMIYSASDASKVAKRKNIAFRSKRNTLSLKVAPSFMLDKQEKSLVTGLKLNIQLK